MSILRELAARQKGNMQPFLIYENTSYYFKDITEAESLNIDAIRPGDVVALIGDYNPVSLNLLFRLIDSKAIITPLTAETRARHEYYFNAAGVDVVIDNGKIERIRDAHHECPLLNKLRHAGHTGLILFSSGSTGEPKAILHDFDDFIIRYRTPRHAYRTMSFLLFDHIGGINTLLHTLYNRGTVIVPRERSPSVILEDIIRHCIELLPTTPTFLRMLLLSGILEEKSFPDLKLITYGTERMGELTLKQLCTLLPHVDFRQTYGMSELGILRVKSRARDSLWIDIGGEDIETRVKNKVLQIRAKHCMLGYMNAPSPFDSDGWYDTKDTVEQDAGWLQIVGRSHNVVNVGGLKITSAEIENIAQLHPAVAFAKAEGKPNAILGEHIELTVEPRAGMILDRKAMRSFFQSKISEALIPHRIIIDKVPRNYRFKQS